MMREFVRSQNYTSTDEVMTAMKNMFNDILQEVMECELAEAEGYDDEFSLYEKVEHIAPEVIAKKRKIYKGVAANVDFYSGLLYSMLNIPCELYTPMFATARIAGWSAHRLEELINSGKIIRPAYMSIAKEKKYVLLEYR